MNAVGAAAFVHCDSGHEVQVQKGQVHQVIPRQWFLLEMGMDATKAL